MAIGAIEVTVGGGRCNVDGRTIRVDHARERQSRPSENGSRWQDF